MCLSPFPLPSIPEQAVGCYCCLLELERSPEQPDADGNGYVICFMGGSEKGLNLYPLQAPALLKIFLALYKCIAFTNILDKKYF